MNGDRPLLAVLAVNAAQGPMLGIVVRHRVGRLPSRPSPGHISLGLAPPASVSHSMIGTTTEATNTRPT